MVTKKEVDNLIKSILTGMNNNPGTGFEMSQEDWNKIPNKKKMKILQSYSRKSYLNFMIFRVKD